MGGWVGGRVDGWMGGRMGGCLDGWGGWADGWVDGWVDGWADGWVGGWMQTHSLAALSFPRINIILLFLSREIPFCASEEKMYQALESCKTC